MTRGLLAAVVLLASVAAGAQEPSPRAIPQADTAGSAALSGVVVTADDAQPVRRARVILTGLDADVARSTITGDDGRFSMEGLPAGRFLLAATKPGFLRAEYGARRAGSPATPIVLGGGQAISDVTIAIARGAVISGTIVDEFGLPAADLEVHVLRHERRGSGLRMVPPGVWGGRAHTRTDDRGMFRFYGLPDGSYGVVAVPPPSGGSEIRTMTAAEIRAALQAARPPANVPGRAGEASREADGVEAPPPVTVGYAPIYYPGVTDALAASVVSVAAGEERAGIDFQIRTVQTARIEGTVVAPAGVSPETVHLVMTPADGALMPAFIHPDSMRVAAVSSEGRFTFAGVPPGRHVITARSGGTGALMLGSAGEAMRSFSLRSFRNGPAIEGAVTAQATTSYWGQAEVTASGFGVDGIVIAMQPGMTMAGRVVFEGGPPPERTNAVISLVPAGVPGGPAAGTVHQTTQIGADGAFTIEGITPGRYSLAAFLLPGETASDGPWTLKSATAGGQNVLDFPLEVGPAADLSNTLITFTSRSQEVSGILLDGSDRPAAGYTIVIFPADPAYWTSARRLLTARSGTDGRFVITNPPAGSYRLAAVTELSRDDLADPAVLEHLAAGSLPLTVIDGERTVQDVRIGPGS